MIQKEATNMIWLYWIALVLIVVGALNWGLVGLFNFNLVDRLFGQNSAVARVIYVLVGIAGIYAILTLPTAIRVWASSPR